jgi:hypothetical protein
MAGLHGQSQLKLAKSDHRRFAHSCDKVCSLSVRSERSAAKSKATAPAKDEVHALENVSLQILDGTFVAASSAKSNH